MIQSRDTESIAAELTRQGVESAYALIKSKIKKTPVLTSESISAIATGNDNPPTRLFFKCENFQKGGSFKIRGATHALENLRPEELENGVITHSSGNHAQALAIAARAKGVKAYIVMPSNSARPKVEATRSYGGNVTFSGPTAPEREYVAETIRTKTNAHFIPPYDHPHIILGQGTVLRELISQADVEYGCKLDAVIVPVGGGGLLAGCALAAHGTGVRVFAAEPALADDCFRGIEIGIREPNVTSSTVADGLRTPVGVINFPIIQKYVEKVFTVSDEEILAAMRLVWERIKIVIEPSGAVALAVALSERWKIEGVKGNIGIIFSGGNVDLDKISDLIKMS
ncbi:tryptophan synthase beta subunit-like PLP-dependent enzyme [Lipomyces kononenkoae]|uniref:Tryptophan synthase beta subunit-like PLP-dependent enzyme n=1 Tax=Lipomyces kononenkoae TaxID=34357 RepID=A0ACC3T1P9_LIPKO